MNMNFYGTSKALPSLSLPWAMCILSFLKHLFPYFTCCSAVQLWIFLHFWVRISRSSSCEKDIGKGPEKEADPISSLEQKCICGIGEKMKPTDHLTFMCGPAEGPLRCNQFFSASTSKGHLRIEDSEERTRRKKDKHGETEENGKSE